MKNNIIKVAIIGYGKMGKIRHDELLKNKNFKLIKIYDPCVKNKNLFVSNINQIFNDKSINSIFICSPNYLNFKYTYRGLKKNKNIFCEKPPTITFKQISKIKSLLAVTKKILMYGFNHRHYHSIQMIKKIIESKKYGKVIWMRGRYGKSLDKSFFSSWRSKKNKSGGGILFDQGIHMLDLMLYFAGGFDKVQSLLTNTFWKLKIEDNAFINLFNKKKNIAASIHSTSTQWRHLFSLEVFFEKGYAVLNGLKTPSNSYGKEVLTLANNRTKPPQASWTKERKYNFSENESWKNELSMFEKSIQINKQPIIGNIDDAIKIMKLLKLIYENNKK